jgi:hypothetical protein
MPVVRCLAALLGASIVAAATLKGSADAASAAAELDRIRSLLVSWRGTLVLERYDAGARASTAANLKSAAKSIISALVGIAIDRKAIAGVRQPSWNVELAEQVREDRRGAADHGQRSRMK